MRDILFKAKRIDNGEWVEGYPIICGDRLFIVDTKNKAALRSFTTHHADRYDWRSVEVSSSTICQYTGFTDRDGDKIWENDVLHVVEQMSNLTYQGTNLISHPHWVNKSNFKVDFTPGGLMNTQRFSNCSSIECEVIGNVFDNPELLEKIGDVHNV